MHSFVYNCPWAILTLALFHCCLRGIEDLSFSEDLLLLKTFVF